MIRRFPVAIAATILVLSLDRFRVDGGRRANRPSRRTTQDCARRRSGGSHAKGWFGHAYV